MNKKTSEEIADLFCMITSEARAAQRAAEQGSLKRVLMFLKQIENDISEVKNKLP